MTSFTHTLRLFVAPRATNRTNDRTNVPAGKLRTPAPTILLIKLNTSVGIVAVPPPEVVLPPPPPPAPPRGTAAALSAPPALLSEADADADAEEALPKFVAVDVLEADFAGDHNEDEDEEADNPPLCLGAKAKQWLWLDKRSSPRTAGRTIMVKDGLLLDILFFARVQ